MVISLAGAAILSFMALGMFRGLPRLTIDWGPTTDLDRQNGLPRAAIEAGTAARGGAKTPKRGSDVDGNSSIMASGALLSLANPNWVVWWATIGLTFLSRSQEVGILGILFFFLGHQAADFAWYSIVSTTVGKGRRFLSDRIYRGVIGVSAVILAGFALYFGRSGLSLLLS